MKKFKIYKFKPVTIGKLRFKSLEYHRNGVSGMGFYIAVATDKEEKKDMLITWFPEVEDCACAVVSLDLLPNIEFGRNSWRGDHYIGLIKEAVKVMEVQMDEFYKYLDTESK